MNGTTPLGIDTAKLLKTVSGDPWSPGSISSTVTLDSVITDADEAPESAVFVIREGNAELAFFNSEYTEVPPVTS
jgi:hypothetical protein